MNSLLDTAQSPREEEKGTHGSVNRLVPLQPRALPQSVVRPPKDDARAAVGHQAGVDRAKAAEEARVPWLRALRRLGVDVFARARQHVVEAVGPFLDISVADRAGLRCAGGGLLGLVLLLGGGHCGCGL